ncbi:dehydrogenase [Polaribacter filamentus]|uniref:Dehydrogenase n=1 Tax=Polaribacter filamentus TaxID=53483 RepID=A0A2S7KYJ3_9FLAO|nr:Gfo/Idh/MocA family oxidoreductase [Polaribacter filamentus]PQB07680.1 dehydrogenase [Polaribacter filamentus]
MKRREFIAKGGLVSAGALVGTSAIYGMANSFSVNNRVNIGVIGTGDRGSGLIPLLNQIDGVQVAACCDVLPFRLEEGLAKTENKAKGYSDYKKMLDNKDVDAIIVSTPFYTHSKIAMDALDAGKHVYCEKTMAKGYQGINDLVKKVSTSSTVFQTGHQYHNSKLYAHVVNLIKQGEIGKVALFECQWNRHGNWRRPLPDSDLERAINWRMYREYSGGLVAELCSHQIDFIHWVLGENPKKIMGTGGIDYWKDGRDTYDNIHLIYEYPSGVKATFGCLTSNAFENYQIKVQGDKGTILLGSKEAWIYYEKGLEKEYGDVDGVSGATMNAKGSKGILIDVPHQNPSKLALIDFKENIINHKLPISNVHTGANTAIAVQLSLDAIYNEKIMHWNQHQTKMVR